MPYKNLHTRRRYHRQYGRKFYYKHRDRILADLQTRKVAIDRLRHERIARVKSVVAKLKDVPCLDCGQKFPACCMEYDHREPKKKVKAVGNMIGQAYTLETVLAEIAKCDLVCANCHRIRHHVAES